MDEVIKELEKAISFAEKQESKAIPVTLEWLEMLRDAIQNGIYDHMEALERT